MKIILKILIFAFLLLGCHKNCPKPGKYQFSFIGTYEIDGVASSATGEFTITETSKDAFYIGSAKINKYGKDFIGELCCMTNYSWVKIIGKCSKKWGGKNYLKGTYEAANYSGSKVTGEFEMKPI